MQKDKNIIKYLINGDARNSGQYKIQRQTTTLEQAYNIGLKNVELNKLDSFDNRLREEMLSEKTSIEMNNI